MHHQQSAGRERSLFPSSGEQQFLHADPRCLRVQRRRINGYNQRVTRALGLSQMAIGMVCLVFNCLLIEIRPNGLQIYLIGYGIWGGILFLITGLLTLTSSVGSPNRDLLIATMEMDIISACISPLIVAFGVLDAHPIMPEYSLAMSISTGVILVALTLVDAVISVFGSILCCRVLCRARLDSIETLEAPCYVVDNRQLSFLPNDSVRLLSGGLFAEFVATSGHVRRPSAVRNDLVTHGLPSGRRASGISEFPDHPPPSYWKSWISESSVDQGVELKENKVFMVERKEVHSALQK